MNTLIINVDSSVDGVKVLEALCEEDLWTYTIDPDAGRITVEHTLAVRLMRLYTRLTGRTPQHMEFPTVVMYSNI